MAVTPSGVLSLPAKYMRDMIAASSTWQTWVADALTPETRVYYGHADEEEVFAADGDTLLPFAVIEDMDFMLPKEGFGGRNHFYQRGALAVRFVAPVSSSDSHSDAFMRFRNNIGGVLDDLMSISGTPGYLDITDMAFLEGGPSRTAPEERQSYYDTYELTMRMDYGPRDGQ